jgi:hypothetical protein
VSHFKRKKFPGEIFVGHGEVSLGLGKIVTMTPMPRSYSLAEGTTAPHAPEKHEHWQKAIWARQV